ncbi:MAG: UDP-N-acetylmuramoyl-L-alanyl-D-glutamate--2,6-diaminopimelate ligase [Chloroflexota bacterium]
MGLKKREKPPHSLHKLLERWQTAVKFSPYSPPAYSGPDISFHQLVENTALIEPGDAFVARVRPTSDGHPYIQQAIEKGAELILAQRSAAELELTVPEDVVYWQVPDTAVALAWLSAAQYGFPSRQLILIGVTGTDGKTSTANILYAILQQAGIKTGLLSTIRAALAGEDELLALHVTTPEAPVVQQYLRRMVDSGLTHAVLESTSIGLDQHRVGAVDFDVAVVTNITHEHLDYHGSYEAYVAAKKRLFDGLAEDIWVVPAEKAAVEKTAVLNRDDSSYEPLASVSAPKQLSYSLHHTADTTANNIHYSPAQTCFDLHLPNTPPLSIATKLLGEFNIYNMLAAAAVAYTLGIEPSQIQQGLCAVDSISGRMERIDGGQSFLTIVDFAHTPDSLVKAIGVARRMLVEGGNGRIITVFGSAGKRDIAKRSMMAAASAQNAELTILTAEDPRTDSLDEILQTMAEACREHGGRENETFWRIPDRGNAIYFALTRAQPQDVVLICGKGHEQSMCFGAIEYPWDDREATKTALAAWQAGEPMVDLGLPTFREKQNAFQNH